MYVDCFCLHPYCHPLFLVAILYLSDNHLYRLFSDVFYKGQVLFFRNELDPFPVRKRFVGIALIAL